MSDRLAALKEACNQLQAAAQGKVPTGKLTRALARLDKTESLAWLNTPTLTTATTPAACQLTQDPELAPTPAVASQPPQVPQIKATDLLTGQPSDQ